jgi:hypothetical protein
LTSHPAACRQVVLTQRACLADGEVAEYAPPRELLANPDGMLSAMVAGAGASSAAQLRRIASAAGLVIRALTSSPSGQESVDFSFKENLCGRSVTFSTNHYQFIDPGSGGRVERAGSAKLAYVRAPHTGPPAYIHSRRRRRPGRPSTLRRPTSLDSALVCKSICTVYT